MNKSDFERLKKSVRQMVAIEQGEATPARKLIYRGKVLIRIEENGEEVWTLAEAAKQLPIAIKEAGPRTMGGYITVLRETLMQSQQGFAELLSIPLATLKGWEQGRRQPDAAAEKLLRVTGANPVAVLTTDDQLELALE